MYAKEIWEVTTICICYNQTNRWPKTTTQPCALPRPQQIWAPPISRDDLTLKNEKMKSGSLLTSVCVECGESSKQALYRRFTGGAIQLTQCVRNELNSHLVGVVYWNGNYARPGSYSWFTQPWIYYMRNKLVWVNKLLAMDMRIWICVRPISCSWWLKSQYSRTFCFTKIT